MTPDQEKRLEELREYVSDYGDDTALDEEGCLFLLSIVDAQAARIKELEGYMGDIIFDAKTFRMDRMDSVRDCVNSMKVSAERALSGPPKTQGG